MMKFGTFLNYEWHETREGKEFAGCLLRRNRRRRFGLLDQPIAPHNIKTDVVSYKLFLTGKSGTGKTSLVCKLQGSEVPKNHSETLGIQTSIVYWPAKINRTKEIILFKFMFWDVGEHVLRKFDHLLPACKENSDTVIFVFSLTNRASWDDLPALMSRTDVDENVMKIVVGTKHDQSKSIQVTKKDIMDFEKVWKIPVFKIGNVDGPRQADGKHLDGRAGIKDTAPFLNRLAELLWHRDQTMSGAVNPQINEFLEAEKEDHAVAHDDQESRSSRAPVSQRPEDIDYGNLQRKLGNEGLKVTFC